MIPIKLYGLKHSVIIYALCDDASTAPLLESKIAGELGVEGQREKFAMDK